MIVDPEGKQRRHVRENAAAGDLVLNETDLAEIDAAHPAPTGKQRLGIL